MKGKLSQSHWARPWRRCAASDQLERSPEAFNYNFPKRRLGGVKRGLRNPEDEARREEEGWQYVHNATSQVESWASQRTA